MKTLPIFVALHPTPGEGETPSEEHNSLASHLRDSLRMSGFEDKASNNDILRFRFERLISALVAVHESLDSFRNNSTTSKNEKQTLPVKFIFHYISHRADPLPAYCESGSTLWSSLQNEKLHVSRALKLKWPELQEIKKPLHCRFELEDEGLYRAEYTQKPDFHTERLFKYRHLLLNGSEQECYYCGLSNHKPSKCPSKMLTMESQGIQNLGYISFQQINDAFVKVFQNPDAVHKKLSAGIKPNQLKNDHELLVYTSFFDLFRVFQPRFLYKITFTKAQKWQDLISNEAQRLVLDDSNLNLAIDCLRVGQYEKGEKKFLAATGHQEEKLFYAYVGLALVALEKGRIQDMGHFLDTACSNATKEKEKVYIYLLLARYFKITGNLWKAQNNLASALKIKHDLIEANYLNALIEVASGFSEKAMGELRTTLNGPREFFMILMLDPQLLPFHGFIDEILQAKQEIMRKEADEQMVLARTTAEATTLWLGKGDQNEKGLNKRLEALQQQHNVSNYYDIIDVINKSKDLIVLCNEIKETCLDEIANKTKRLGKALNKVISFWNLFPHKRFFKKTLGQISAIKEKISLVQKLIKSKKSESYQQGLAHIVEIEKINGDLQKSLHTMKKVAVFMDNFKIFGRKLVLFEVIFLLVLLPLGLALFPESSFATNSAIQRKIFLITGCLIGPITALSLAFSEISKRNIGQTS
nr:hypothetical protein [Desulfobulbaceae bacterium]